MHIRLQSTKLILSIIATLSMACSSFGMEVSTTPADNRWSSVGTIATGAAVGAANGILSRITDHIWPFNWILLSSIQKTLLRALALDAHKAGETVDERLLHDSAWISSWISWAMATQTFDVSYPAQPALWIVIR